MNKIILASTLCLILLISSCAERTTSNNVIYMPAPSQQYTYQTHADQLQQAVNAYNIGVDFERRGQGNNALQYYLKAHQLGLEDGTKKVIEYYISDINNHDNVQYGIQLLRNSNLRHSPYAFYIMGVVNFLGIGGYNVDKKKAIEFLTFAADNGIIDARRALENINKNNVVMHRTNESKKYNRAGYRRSNASNKMRGNNNMSLEELKNLELPAIK